MRAIILFILTSFSFACFSQSNIGDSIYSKMFEIASGKIVRNDSVFQIFADLYVVITVTDIVTGQTKEICTEYSGIEGAIIKDSGNAYVDTKNRIFKFKSKEALNNVGFFDFNSEKYKNCTCGITVEKLLKEWNEDYNEDYMEFSEKYFGDCEKYYAFLLFKNGILTKSGYLIGEFSIISDKELKEYENRIKQLK